MMVTWPSSNGPRAGQAKRRTFTAEYKLRILDEYETAAGPAAQECAAAPGGDLHLDDLPKGAALLG